MVNFKRQAVKNLMEIINIGPMPPANPNNGEQMAILEGWEKGKRLLETFVTNVIAAAKEEALREFEASTGPYVAPE